MKNNALLALAAISGSALLWGLYLGVFPVLLEALEFSYEENEMEVFASMLSSVLKVCSACWVEFLVTCLIAFFSLKLVQKLRSNQSAQVNPCNPPVNPRIT